MENHKLRCVILVGGPSKGTRFRPLSFDIPKPLFPVAGFPMIYHQLHAISKLPEVSDVILLGSYERSKFSFFIENVEKYYGLRCRYLQEDKLTGTAGGLYQFREEIFDRTTDVLIIHCDICSNFPLKEMYTFHKSHGKLCSLMSIRVSKKESLKYGNFIKDPISNELIHHAEKPESFVSDLINCGIYIFSKDLASYLIEIKGKKDKQNLAMTSDFKTSKKKFFFKLSSLDEENLTLENDVLNGIAGQQKAYIYELNRAQGHFWHPIKTPGEVLAASFHYIQFYGSLDDNIYHKGSEKMEIKAKNVLINPSSEIDPSANIGSNVIIGSGVKISAGVRISNSVILDGVEVYPHACILNSIVGWNSIIGSWTRVEGSVTDDKESAGREVDTVTILGVGVTVEPEICIRNCVVLPNKILTESYSDKTII